LHFRKAHYCELKEKYRQWQSSCADQIPDPYRHQLAERANELFAEMDVTYGVKSP